MVILVIAVGVNPAEASTGQADPVSAAPVPPGFVSLQSCVRERHRLSVLFLIDESASLSSGAGATDPDDNRVPGIKAALSGLLRLSSATPEGVKVEAAFTGFSEDASERFDWQRLDQSNLPALERSAQGFADRDKGKGTNYEAALERARGQLLDRAAAGSSDGRSDCSLLVFFTDGNYQRADRDHNAEAAGLRNMCAPNGVMDDLRTSGVITIVVALSSNGISADGAALLKGIAEGDAPCRGAAGTPQTGTYLPVGRADDLFFKLGTIGGTAGGMIKTGTSVGFPAVEGLSSFDVRADLPPSGELGVVGPGGHRRVFRRGRDASATLDGATIDVHWTTDDLVEITGQFPASSSDWQGPWKIDFKREARYTVALGTGFRLRLTEPKAFRLGETGPVGVELLGASGRRARGPLARGAALSAQVTVPNSIGGAPGSIELARGADGTWSGTYAADSAIESAQLRVAVQADLPAAGDIPLEPVVTSVLVDTRPPAAFPEVRPGRLELPKIKGARSSNPEVEGDLRVLGSRLGTSCIWFESGRFEAPRRTEVVASVPGMGTNKQDCLSLRQGEVRDLVARVKADHVEDGYAAGTLRFGLVSAQDGSVRFLELPVGAPMQRDRNIHTLGEILGLLLLICILTPLLILHGINWLTARLTPGNRVRSAMVPVLVDGDRVTRQDGSPISFDPAGFYTDFLLLDDSPSSRRKRQAQVYGFTIASRASFRLRPWCWFLMRGPTAFIRSTRPFMVGNIHSRRRLRVLGDGQVREIPIAYVGSWIFQPEEAAVLPPSVDLTGAKTSRAPGRPGRLVVLVPSEGGLSQPAQIVAEVQRVVPARFGASAATSEAGDDEAGGIGDAIRALLGRIRNKLKRDDSRSHPKEPDGPPSALPPTLWPNP